MVYFDKLFVMTPQGDLRVLLDEGDPQQVDALERQFFASHVTEGVLFATGRPGNRTLDGQCTVRRTRPADRLYRIAQGEAYTVFPGSRPRPSDGASGRCSLNWQLGAAREALR